MKSNPYHIAELISKYLRNQLSEEEDVLLQQWLDESEENQQLLESFRDDHRVQQDIDFIGGINIKAAWTALERRHKWQRRRKILRYVGYAAAILLIGFSWVWFSNRSPVPLYEGQQTANVYHNDVEPGGNKAKLILSDGRTVDLQEYLDGIHEQDGTQINGGEGKLTYSTQQAIADELIFNTLSIPKAGTYHLTLADGTKVWLNAMSELRFPVQFNNKERVVYLKGEAYFEIAADHQKPFKVEVGGTQIEVLGTHFNINSYKQLVATLVEGSVKISNETGEQIMNPGQEARVGERITLHQANIAKTMAWKKGEFFFASDGIQEIMEQLSRWYDLDVRFEGNIPKAGINGSISRTVNLSQVLEMLTYVSGATFEVGGKQVTVKF